jgi:hypothetical protein
VLIALLILIGLASAAFWLASRGSTYRWYSAPIAGLASFTALPILHGFLIQYGRGTMLVSVFVALVLVPVVLARVFAEQKFRSPASPPT